MNFTPGAKVYVCYSTGIMPSVTEILTISKYKNNLLYFEEKTSYYAVECYAGSFFGYSNTLAGRVIVTKHKWQVPFAMMAEKMNLAMPVKPARQIKEAPALKLRLSEL